MEFALILHAIPGLDRDFDAIVDQPKGANSQKLLDAAFKFYDDFIEQGTFTKILAGLAERHLAEGLLRQLALDMVPWFGWGWFAISFVLALHRNWDRLVASLA